MMTFQRRPTCTSQFVRMGNHATYYQIFHILGEVLQDFQVSGSYDTCCDYFISWKKWSGTCQSKKNGWRNERCAYYLISVKRTRESRNHPQMCGAEVAKLFGCIFIFFFFSTVKKLLFQMVGVLLQVFVEHLLFSMNIQKPISFFLLIRDLQREPPKWRRNPNSICQPGNITIGANLARIMTYIGNGWNNFSFLFGFYHWNNSPNCSQDAMEKRNGGGSGK